MDQEERTRYLDRIRELLPAAQFNQNLSGEQREKPRIQLDLLPEESTTLMLEVSTPYDDGCVVVNLWIMGCGVSFGGVDLADMWESAQKARRVKHVDGIHKNMAELRGTLFTT